MTGFLETQSQNPRFSGHQSRIQNYKPISEVIDFPDSLEIATGFLETQSTSKVKILFQNVIESQPKNWPALPKSDGVSRNPITILQPQPKKNRRPITLWYTQPKKNGDQSHFGTPSQKKSATSHCHTVVNLAKKKWSPKETIPIRCWIEPFGF